MSNPLARQARLAAFAVGLLLSGCNAPSPGSDAPAKPATAALPAPAAPITPAATPPAKSEDTGYAVLDASVIAATDTLATLRERYGDADAVAAKVPGAEGAEFDGWVLFPGDEARRAYVYLDDDGKPSMVSVLDAPSHWQRADGIRTGLTLAELVQRNGAPVTFMGFDWDYGGGITNWNGGHLQRDPPVGAVQLCPPEIGDNASLDDYPAGESEFDSTNAWVIAHPPTVCEFSVNLAPSPASEPAP